MVLPKTSIVSAMQRLKCCVHAGGAFRNGKELSNACDGVPKGIRTPVTAVKGQCPRPLDDGDNVVVNLYGSGGAKRDRTADLLHAMQALSQLSYSPVPRICILRGILTSVNNFVTFYFFI